MTMRETYGAVRALVAAVAALWAWTAVQADTLQLLWWEMWPDEIEVWSKDKSEMLGTGDESFLVDGEWVDITGARVRAVDPSGNFSYLTIRADDYSDTVAPSMGMWYADVSAYSAGSPEYSFVIEIGNWDEDAGTWTGVAMSESLSYSNLGEHLFTWDSGNGNNIDPQAVSAWAPDAYAVPEPTSALLLVFGVALMGLQRRVRV